MFLPKEILRISLSSEESTVVIIQDLSLSLSPWLFSSRLLHSLSTCLGKEASRVSSHSLSLSRDEKRREVFLLLHREMDLYLFFLPRNTNSKLIRVTRMLIFLYSLLVISCYNLCDSLEASSLSSISCRTESGFKVPFNQYSLETCGKCYYYMPDWAFKPNSKYRWEKKICSDTTFFHIIFFALEFKLCLLKKKE